MKESEASANNSKTHRSDYYDTHGMSFQLIGQKSPKDSK